MSQSTGFPQCPTARGLRGALILLAPSTEMSRIIFISRIFLGTTRGVSSDTRVRITAAGRQELAERR